MSDNLEQLQDTREHGIEVQNSAAEQLESLSNKSEVSAELSPRDAEAQAEQARIKALETAVSVEAGGKETKKAKEYSAPSRRGSISTEQRDKSYKQTIKHIQAELPIASRTFSKIIHNKLIEKTSDIVGNTIARPNAMLAGAVVAFILTLATYTTAKTIGYSLSGFETIAAFIIGWIIGITYDYLRVLITGKKL
jgi:hypothetical protein